MTGAAALAAAAGVLAGACVANRAQAPAREAAELAVARPASRGLDRAVTAPDARVERPKAPADVTVYYLGASGSARYLAPEEHLVPYAPSADGAAMAAVTELLAAAPRSAGATRPFPAGTRLLGLRLDDGTATVNLSREALGAAGPDGYPVQALVWTVTQLPRAKRVVVQVEGRGDGAIDGRPLAALLGAGTGGRWLARDPDAKLTPILLAEPSPRAAVAGDRVVARGQARVAAGTVGLRLRDPAGRVVSQGYAVVGSSGPAWGEFSGALTFQPPATQQLWTVEVFESSQVDASVTYSVAVPVWVGG